MEVGVDRWTRLTINTGVSKPHCTRQYLSFHIFTANNLRAERQQVRKINELLTPMLKERKIKAISTGFVSSDFAHQDNPPPARLAQTPSRDLLFLSVKIFSMAYNSVQCLTTRR